jgi:DNA-binding SARP family transcriptional activator
MYEDIIHELNKAIMIDYFEEELHITLIETLLAEGKISQARAHYENVTGKFYKDLGLKPSSSFKQIFRLIKAHDEA